MPQLWGRFGAGHRGQRDYGKHPFQGLSAQYILVGSVDGSVSYIIDNIRNGRIRPGQMLLLPANNPFQLTAAASQDTTTTTLYWLYPFLWILLHRVVDARNRRSLFDPWRVQHTESVSTHSQSGVEVYFNGLLLCINQGSVPTLFLSSKYRSSSTCSVPFFRKRSWHIFSRRCSTQASPFPTLRSVTTCGSTP